MSYNKRQWLIYALISIHSLAGLGCMALGIWWLTHGVGLNPMIAFPAGTLVLMLPACFFGSWWGECEKEADRLSDQLEDLSITHNAHIRRMISLRADYVHHYYLHREGRQESRLFIDNLDKIIGELTKARLDNEWYQFYDRDDRSPVTMSEANKLVESFVNTYDGYELARRWGEHHPE